jgi:hypothetical protein
LIVVHKAPTEFMELDPRRPLDQHLKRKISINFAPTQVLALRCQARSSPYLGGPRRCKNIATEKVGDTVLCKNHLGFDPRNLAPEVKLLMHVLTLPK